MTLTITTDLTHGAVHIGAALRIKDACASNTDFASLTIKVIEALWRCRNTRAIHAELVCRTIQLGATARSRNTCPRITDLIVSTFSVGAAFKEDALIINACATKATVSIYNTLWNLCAETSFTT